MGRRQPWTSLAARLVLAGFLGLAGILKLPDPAQSVRAVRAHDLLPEGVVQVVGYGLPVLEVALAGLLLLGLATRFAAVASAVLMVAFLVGVASAAGRGLAIDCGCFGGGGVVAPPRPATPRSSCATPRCSASGCSSCAGRTAASRWTRCSRLPRPSTPSPSARRPDDPRRPPSRTGAPPAPAA